MPQERIKGNMGATDELQQREKSLVSGHRKDLHLCRKPWGLLHSMRTHGYRMRETKVRRGDVQVNIVVLQCPQRFVLVYTTGRGASAGFGWILPDRSSSSSEQLLVYRPA